HHSLPALLSFPTRRSSDLPDHAPRSFPNPAAILPRRPSAGNLAQHTLRLRILGSVWDPFQFSPSQGLPASLTRSREDFQRGRPTDRKSTRLNSSHVKISYA